MKIDASIPRGLQTTKETCASVVLKTDNKTNLDRDEPTHALCLVINGRYKNKGVTCQLKYVTDCKPGDVVCFDYIAFEETGRKEKTNFYPYAFSSPKFGKEEFKKYKLDNQIISGKVVSFDQKTSRVNFEGEDQFYEVLFGQELVTVGFKLRFVFLPQTESRFKNKIYITETIIDEIGYQTDFSSASQSNLFKSEFSKSKKLLRKPMRKLKPSVSFSQPDSEDQPEMKIEKSTPVNELKTLKNAQFQSLDAEKIDTEDTRRTDFSETPPVRKRSFLVNKNSKQSFEDLSNDEIQKNSKNFLEIRRLLPYC